LNEFPSLQDIEMTNPKVEIPEVPAKPKSLVEQKADFTSEGAPPPGKVVGSVVPALVEAEADAKPEGSKTAKKS
jgi:hypothetical protein